MVIDVVVVMNTAFIGFGLPHIAAVIGGLSSTIHIELDFIDVSC